MPRRVWQLISTAALSCALLLLCGCEIRMDVHLRADGTGTANVACYLSPSDQAMGVTATDMKQALAEQFEKRPDVKITQGSSSGGTQYVKATVPFSNVQELASTQSGVYEYEKQPNGDKCTFRVLHFSLAGPSMVPVQFELQMPGKILASNADSVHGNVAHWSDAALRRIPTWNASSEGLYAESETTGMFPYPLALLVLASILSIGILLLYLLRSKRLKSARASTGAVAGAKLCPNCGAENRPRAVFCLKCGTRLPEAQSTQTTDDTARPVKSCPSCGARNRSEVNFCTKCGIRFPEVERTTK
jgi:ribosomal protein L40E